jgi:hypothetical protein
MSNVLSKVCLIPRDFYSHQNKSVIQLFNESGYLEQRDLVTKEKLMEYLMANPDLITDWENYSSDKRYSPGWYLLKDQSQWIVGYSSVPSQEQKTFFTSGTEACAEFILHELEEWTEHRTRH